MTVQAFALADRDRNPVLLLCDGVIGTMMEPVVLPEMMTEAQLNALKESKRSWAAVGHKLDYENRGWIQPGNWSTAVMQQGNEQAAQMYRSWQENDVQVEEYQLADAELVLVAYGISARIAKTVVDSFRAQGKKIGLIRPLTVHPFPYAAIERLDYRQVKAILDIEMSIPAQMIQDVSMAVQGRCPIHSCLCSGGNLLKRETVVEAVSKLI